ncbi:hypothetical protein TrRE_jg5317 [Triparma retinervis]|uniref:Uncharacterized protein n=1 Tax=Triparma retinervis TaxID=2557542 RepID=A0A9W6ZKV3_9STRA|nr:hypothetical protein TrRE_jg5317 [Triparma retinervis]
MNFLSSGLNQGGRIASWLVAAGVVVAWNYKDGTGFGFGGDKKGFTKEEMNEWNKKAKHSKKEKNEEGKRG